MARFSVISAALAAVLLAAPAAAHATATPPRTTTDPAAAAAGWLAQQFGDHLNFPGSSYFDGGATADAVFALAASGSGRTKIDAAMRYFAAHVDDYTNLQDTDLKPGPYDGSVGKTAAAAFVAGGDPRAFGGHDLLAALHRDQCTKVSAPKNNNDYTTPTCPAIGAARNIFSSVSESFAILAQGRAATAYSAALGPDAAALRYFLSLQCPDGGFTVDTTTTSGCTSDIDATAYALMALEALPHPPAAQTRAAVGFLRAQQHGGGYWIAQGGPNVDSTGLAAAALDGAGRDTPDARTWLAAQQVTTGPTVGAGASRGALAFEARYDPSSAVKATSDGVLGLVRHGSLATLTDAPATPDTAVLALAAPTLTARTVAAGAADKVTGTGFSRSETVTVTLGRTKVAAGHADTNGTVAVDVSVPRSIAAGSYALTLTGATSGLSTATTLAVRAAAPPPSSPPPSAHSSQPPRSQAAAAPSAAPSSATPVLASTGAPDLGPLLAVGGGSLVLGVVALLLGRRKRT